MKAILTSRLLLVAVILAQYALLAWDGSINEQLLDTNGHLLNQLVRANVALRLCADRSQRSAD